MASKREGVAPKRPHGCSRRDLIMQGRNAIQDDVTPALRSEIGIVTPTLARVVHILDRAYQPGRYCDRGTRAACRARSGRSRCCARREKRVQASRQARSAGVSLPDPAPAQPVAAGMLAELPTACACGTKCNAQGYKMSWNGYKLHIGSADCGVPVAALLCPASVH